MAHEVDQLGKGPLGGKSYCVTGVFENITREKLEYFIKSNDGRLASSVSGKTDYLITGKLLDDNRPVVEGGKYKRAMQLGIKIMGEKEFELFCREKFENPDFLLGRKTKKDTTEGAQDYFVASGNQATAIDEILDISDLLGQMQQKPALSDASTRK